MKKLFQFIFHRAVIGSLLMLIQLAMFIVMISWFQQYFVYFYAVCVIISMAVTIYILNNRSNPAYKIAWIVLILLVPVFGGLFYLFFGQSRLSARQKRKMSGMVDNFSVLLSGPDSALPRLEREDITAANQSRYIENCALCPPHLHTQAEYLPIGEIKFDRMLKELKAAKRFIFLEYFIIQEGTMWNTILQILEEKVQEGVDVRVIYDDFGCMMILPKNYNRVLEAKGIKCCVFNPFIPILSTSFNNRDHRKICVIDGWVGFTGGINLADEYINAYPKHGHWKDTAILLKGDAVWNLTLMFLSMWDYLRHEQEDFQDFRPGVVAYPSISSAGYVQPYNDSPLDEEPVGETVYLNLINKAQRYVYISTPYLILSNEMITALCTAAHSGIDLRIITPHIADKWYVHGVTRANYQQLIEAGVKIYEYTPGFIHAKTFVVDDLYGVVGTINLDYRSLYLHFECATWMYQTPCIADMKADYLKTLEQCQEITLEQCQAVKWYTRFGRSLLRIFGPLM